MIEAAFIGFQMGAGGDKTFGQYLESLGLSEKKIEPEQNISQQDLIALQRLAIDKFS